MPLRSAALTTCVLAGLASIAAGPAVAEVYRWVDEKGELHFSGDLSQVPPAYRDRVGKPGEDAAHDDHDHTHGDGCGHETVAHGDHVDYIHDGHRHAAHEGHWDEH